MPASKRAAQNAPEPRRVRRFTAAHKIGILEIYDGLDRAGKTEFLRARNLRASQISKWRGQVYAAALEALSADPGGQPARLIHVSDPVWADLTSLAAAAIPPMSAERLARALFNVATGRETRLPAIPGLAVQSTPAEGSPQAEA